MAYHDTRGRNASAPQDPNSRRPPLKREGAGAPTDVRQRTAETSAKFLQAMREKAAARRPQ